MENEKREDRRQVGWPAETIIEKVTRIEQGLFGVPGSEERGLIGEFKEHKKYIYEFRDKTEERLKAIETTCKLQHPDSAKDKLKEVPKTKITAFLITMATFVALVIYTLGKWLGWWDGPSPPTLPTIPTAP